VLHRDAVRAHDVGGAPLARAPVEDFSLAHEDVHRAHGLFDRRFGIRSMAEGEIDVIELQPFQRGVDAFDDVLVREALVVRICEPNVTQAPKDSSLTLMPDFPIRR
jgi:hypothetical protein